MTESEDEHLHKLTQDQIKNISDVSLILTVLSLVGPTILQMAQLPQVFKTIFNSF